MTKSNAPWAVAIAFVCAPTLAFAATGAPDGANAATRTELAEQRSHTLARVLQHPTH